MSKKILISGSSGLVGTALISELKKRGSKIYTLVRREPKNSSEFHWNPANNEIDKKAIEAVDTIVHLAGENVAEGRWTPQKKERILNSRVKGTKLIADAISKASNPPKTWISASAIGIYGSQVEGIVDEKSKTGSGFLAEVCKQWEAATLIAEQSGTQVIHLRIGIVLSKKGGALKKMLLPFRLGLGGVIGSGEQYMSWISLKDLVSSIVFCLDNNLSGPLNAVAPLAVSNRQFTKALGAALGRPTIFPIPAFILKLIFGEMAEETILSSLNCKPSVLMENSFSFEHKEISQALHAII